MKLKLVKLEPKYRRHLLEMMEEWYATEESIVPYAIRRLDYRDFDQYLENLEVKDASGGLVPDSTFFCLDEERDIFVGAVNIRHYLNDKLLLNGGHIGDGVRPSERRKGIATEMIALALRECRKLGISRVLMVCDRDNAGSAKSIRKNGGVLENEVLVDGVWEQRYWFQLKPNRRMESRTDAPGTMGGYKYVVVLSFYEGRILLSRHKERETWETQGGHIEPGESPENAARRELFEESGAVDFDMEPVCDYFARDKDDLSFATGMVFRAEIRKLREIPHSEMVEVRSFARLPENLTYPDISPALFDRIGVR